MEKMKNNQMLSTTKRSNYGSPIKYVTLQRSPYHTPNKDMNAFSSSLYGGISKEGNAFAASTLNS